MATAATDTRQTVARILRRWDGIANQQLIAAATRLAAENDRLREELRRAEDAADGWRENAIRLMEDGCADGARQPGLTRAGALVLVPASAAQGGAA